MRRRLPLPLCVVVLFALGIFLSLTVGSSRIPLGELFSKDNPSFRYILFSLRLPRTFASLLVGMTLALSGLAFQAVLHNPLADPYILGVSSGGSLGAAVALCLGFSSFVPGSLIGGLSATLLMLLLSSRGEGSSRLILFGVAITYLCSSLLTLLMVLHHEQYQRIMFWTLGSLSAVSYGELFLILAIFLLTIFPLFFFTDRLDLFEMDRSTALSVGLDVRKWSRIFLILPTIAIAFCVAYGGVIGFVGLIAPHIARKLVGPKHRRLFPATSFTGALLLLYSDILCRLLLPSGEMPVGVVTSLIGAPLLVFLLLRRKRNG